MNKISNESSQETTTPSAAASRPIKPLPKNFGKRSSTWTSMSNPGNGNAALAKKEEKSEAATTQPSNTFNSTPFNTAPTFTFGGSATAPAPNNTQPPSAPPVIFGAGVNFAQSNGAESTQSVSQFGSSTPVAGPTSSFDFNNQGSSSTGFTFTAGGNGQSFNNPFASSQAQPSTSIFGGNSALPGPPSNINFGFGQQPPSTPRTQGNPVFAGQSKGGNGVPSFNFTQATPPQNNANPFASKPSFGTLGNTGSLLQAGGDTSTGATSPFPAPSSIATTPVNGTPEPQSQNENGEEASQAQASFTEGGPGEEDDVILHEVRAKAIKYVPVVKGSDEDEENKSPWTTQGVGPLRVLKNKTTGNVRILVRAEPRGHVAMNKALLSDVDYKAKDKTITFVASNDSGSGLETWVLQVKKPDIAQQLAGVLETNKSANKK
ncbi:hypothetical protein GGR54DRAFT_594904 [Hypoxylon sp. NC1633]|nr:hypothetical protein GGR54DRAFT_594904 [Hypoxylon sp. NC1633]